MTITHDFRIDRLRLLGCFGVVLLHSSFGADAMDLLLNAVFRFSVPVFVIISGYFMLAQPVPLPKLMKKTGRLFLQMLIWSGIYLIHHWAQTGILPKNIISYFLTEPVHLWYLYATMGLYLLTPALYPFVRSASREEYRYALGFCFVMGCVVVTLVRLDWFPELAVILDKSKLPDMVGFLFLYLMGGYFRVFGISHRRAWLWTGVGATLVSMLCSQTAAASHMLSFLAPNVVIAGCACFVLCMTGGDVRPAMQPRLREWSQNTMGIYLVHLMVSSVVTPYLSPLREIWAPVAVVVVRAVYVFSVSAIVIWLLRKIPVIRRIVC